MRSLSLRPKPVPTLYVKSLGSSCDEDDIRNLFKKARETAPCLLVFEDIDSLVSDNVKSFFLNEVDGLEENDGLMMVGSTNYCAFRASPVCMRVVCADFRHQWTGWIPEFPSVQVGSTGNITSRFPPGRKEFNIANTGGWYPTHCGHHCLLTTLMHMHRSKLSNHSSIILPTQISSAIANITEGFSFAYIQEALVTALLLLVQTQRANLPRAGASMPASEDLESNQVWQEISKQVQTLRKEMKDSRKSVEDSGKNSMLSDATSGSAPAAGFGLAK